MPPGSTPFTPDALADSLARLPRPRAWRIALSGGADSVALLHALAAIRRRQPIPVSALHVDHGLHEASADWAKFCAELCKALNIPLKTPRLQIDRRPGESLEMAARRLRYQALARHIDDDEALLTAHHLDDQAETFLLNLMNGAGVGGLAAIPAQRRFARGWLLRPLLGFAHAQLVDYLQANGLEWIEDPSNADSRFDRNYLRHHVIPAMQARWPAAVRAIGRAVAHQQEQLAVARSLAERDWATAGDFATGGLVIDRLKALPPHRQTNLLRYWLKTIGPSLASETRQLEALFRDVINAGADAAPELTLGGVAIRRDHDRLLKTWPERAKAPPRALSWPLNRPLIADPPGLRLEPQTLLNAIPWLTAEDEVSVRFRQGGERFRPAPDRPRQKLKHLFQRWRVPTHRRATIPLIYWRDELLVVWGYAISRAVFR